MKIQKSVLVVIIISILLACNTQKKDLADTIINEKETPIKTTSSKADILLNETIAAHGGNLYNSAHYSFVFRGNTYQFKNEGADFEYEKISENKNTTTKDKLVNGKFSRFIDDELVTLSEKEIKSATEALNSVIYFATLPHKLNDAAVNSTYIGHITIKDINYDILGITFNKEGGGTDFDDQFHYWINTSTKKIEYLAYNYKVNKGGVRFRSVYNTRVVDGITFQDYVNYKAEVGTSLKDLPTLYEAGKLKELSKIETKNIINLNK